MRIKCDSTGKPVIVGRSSYKVSYNQVINAGFSSVYPNIALLLSRGSVYKNNPHFILFVTDKICNVVLSYLCSFKILTFLN